MERFATRVEITVPNLIDNESLVSCISGITKRIKKENAKVKRAPDPEFKLKHSQNAERLKIIRDELSELLEAL